MSNHAPSGRFVVELSSVYSCSMPNQGSSDAAFSIAIAQSWRVFVGSGCAGNGSATPVSISGAPQHQQTPSATLSASALVLASMGDGLRTPRLTRWRRASLCQPHAATITMHGVHHSCVTARLLLAQAGPSALLRVSVTGGPIAGGVQASGGLGHGT